MSNKMHANVSTIFDLKAELLKKKEELNRQGTSRQGEPSRLFIKGKLPVDKRKEERQAKIEEQKLLNEEEQRKFSQWKDSINAKAALYDRLSQGKVTDRDEDNEPLYLVDFSHNARAAGGSDSEEEEAQKQEVSQQPDTIKRDEDEFVEYTDCFGRTRKCRREDLQKELLIDNRVNEDTARLPKVGKENTPDDHELRNPDQEDVLENLQPIHYQHLKDDEPRALGTAYYQFSLDENIRKEQLKSIKQLSALTKEQRERAARLKERRKNLMDQRLRKVMERKNIVLENDTPASDVNVTDIPLPESGDVVKEKEKGAEKRVKSALSEKRTRPWDEGKMTLSTKRFVKEKREEREAEFAPPPSYFK